jgi:hypothetical protein
MALGSVLTFGMDGADLMAIVDNSIASGAYFQLYSGAIDRWWFDSIGIYDAVAGGLTLAPATVAPASVDNVITVYGTGVIWEEGMPGAPTFTAVSGVITSQTILGAQSAQIIYDAPTTAGVDLITDSVSGLSAFLAVTSSPIPPLVPGTDPFGLYHILQALSNALITLLNQAVNGLLDDEELTESESVLGWVRRIGVPPVGDTLSSLLVAILRQLDTASQDPDSARQVLDGIRSGVIETIEELLALTSSGSYTLSDILDAIAEVPGGGLTQEALDAAVAAIMGDPATATSSVYAIVSGMRTGSSWTLGDIITLLGGMEGDSIRVLMAALLEAVEAGGGGLTQDDLDAAVATLEGASSRTITDAYNRASDAKSAADASTTAVGLVAIALALGIGQLDAAILASTAATEATIAAAVVEVNGAIAALGEGIALALNGLSNAVGDVGDAVDEANDKLDDLLLAIAAIHPTAPVWPGIAHATLLTPVAVAADMHIDVPMDGCLLNLTVIPNRNVYWTVDGLVNVERAGFLVFLSDRGDADERQAVAWSSGVYTPKRLLTCGGVVLHLTGLASGTLTPWVRA